MTEIKYYKTYDINEATFLCVKGFELSSIENSGKRKTFVFDYSDQLYEMVRIFYFGKPEDPDLMVNAQEILQTFRTLKSKLYSNIATN